MKKLSEICRFSFLSCEQYTELASRSIDENITLKERLQFWSHHFLCMVCRRFRRQILFIEEAAKRYECSCEEDHQPLGNEHVLSESAKNKIRESLDNQ